MKVVETMLSSWNGSEYIQREVVSYTYPKWMKYVGSLLL